MFAFPASHEQTSLPNQPFSLWLRGQSTLFIGQIAAILAFVYSLASLIYYVSHATEESRSFFDPLHITLFVDYAHIIFIAIIIIALIKVLDDNDRGSYHVKLVYKRVFNHALSEEEHKELLAQSKGQLNRFKRRFLWFWIVMLLLYVTFACHHSYILTRSQPVESSTVADGSIRVGNKELTFKYSSTAGNTKDKASTPSEEKKLSADAVYEAMAVPFLLFTLNNASLLFVYWCFLIMSLRVKKDAATDRKRCKYSAWTMLGFTLLFPFFAYLNRDNFTDVSYTAYIAVFDALSGTLNAIVLALLIARLDSKLIGLRSWLIGVLYSYAAVQPLFVVFDQRRPVAATITTAVLVFVFISKIYFFLIIIYALQTGRMLNYLSCSPVLREQVDKGKVLGSPAAPDCQREDSTNKIMRYLDRRSKALYARASHVSKWRLENYRASLSSWMRSGRPERISERLGGIATATFFIFLIAYALTLAAGTDLARYLSDGIVKAIGVGVDIAHLIVVGGIIAALFLLRRDNGCDADRMIAIAQKIFWRRPSPDDERFDKSRYPQEKAVNQLRKFKEYFLWFWLALFVLYVVSLSKHLSAQADPQTLSDIAGIRTGIEVLVYPFLQFSFSTINSLFVFWCFVVLQSPAYDERSEKNQKLLINYSGFVVVLLIAAFPLLLFFLAGSAFTEEELLAYATVFEGLTGTLSGVALALLIARLDSKFISLGSSLVRLLFVYAAIQALSVVFNLPEPVFKTMATFVFIAALGLKVCFFLIILHTLQSGKMLNYLVCFPFLKERVDSIFENQFEIRTSSLGTHSFTFSIFKKNQLRYSTVTTFKNKWDCDVAVSKLRERMKNPKAYRPHEESGTHWVAVKVKALQRNLVCESIPLRSEEEASQLIEESIDKVPYCKYNRE
jgi:hypothetical protein